MNPQTCQQFFRKTPAKLLLLFLYFISVNLLAGYAAVLLNFPSLWGNSQVFGEYAIPIGMTWGIAHWPSFVLVSIPLLLLPGWNAIIIRRFREGNLYRFVSYPDIWRY